MDVQTKYHIPHFKYNEPLLLINLKQNPIQNKRSATYQSGLKTVLEEDSIFL